MAFYSGFFNSKGLDRTYTAEDFTSYLSSIICNGILDTYGQMFRFTAASSGLKVTLGTGKAWIDGHYFINDARYSIDLTSYQDESLPRYVAITILLDVGESVRSVSLEITPGTPAENPSLPSLPSDENKTRLLMYAVRLNPDATELTERDWYDYREDKNVCGYCKCILGKCKVTELMSQMAQLITEVQENNETIAELTNKVDTLQTEVDDIIGGIVEIGTCGENIHYVFLSVIKGKQFEFPVYFDLEEKKQFDLGKDKVSAIMRAFLERVEAAGYYVGLYGSASSLTTHTADDIKSRYTIWLAHWCNQTSYGGAYGIWQHSEKGGVDGISGNVDLDIGYKDFPTIIKAKGLNGYGKELNPPAPATEDGIAVEVTVDGRKYSGKLNKT